MPKNICKWLVACWLVASAFLLVASVMRPLALNLIGPSSLPAVVDYLVDDSYYYLGIAANLAETGKSSLDGITLTNGYHPLWLLTLTGLAALVGVDPWTLFVACFWLIGAIAMLGLFALPASLSALRTETALLAATGLAITLVQNTFIFAGGMEPIMMAPLFVPLVVAIEQLPGRRPTFGLSALLALAFLARIDGLVLCGAIAVLLIGETLLKRATPGTHPQRALMPDLLRLFAVVLPVVAIYMIVNTWIFGTAVPVSGLAKSIGGPRFANWGILESFLGRTKPLLVLIAFLLVLEIAAWRSGRSTSLLLRSLFVFAIAAIAQAGYYAAFSTWPTWPWYAYLTTLASALMIARIVHLSLRLLEHQQLRLIAVPILLAVFAFDAIKLRAAIADPLRLLVNGGAAKASVPDSALSYNQISLDLLRTFFAGQPRMQVAMGDRAGGLAYWGRTQLQVVQTEGLTLDSAYLEARRNSRAEQYFLDGFDLRYWIVDREVIPLVTRSDGGQEYVVADPIQGRVTLAPLPTFCFPVSSLVYQRHYGIAPLAGTRFVFRFADRQTCSATSVALIRDAQERQGLRQLSLPGEYDPAAAGALSKAVEDRDRRLARWLDQSSAHAP